MFVESEHFFKTIPLSQSLLVYFLLRYYSGISTAYFAHGYLQVGKYCFLFHKIINFKPFLPRTWLFSSQANIQNQNKTDN